MLLGLLILGVAHHAVTGPLGPLPDALAVRAATGRGEPSARLSYGVVRGAGAACFIAGNLAAGWAIAAAASPLIVLWLNAGLFTLAAAAALLLPPPAAREAHPRAHDSADAQRPAGLRAVLAIASFRSLLLVAGLIAGSHALYAGFATLYWQAAGLSPDFIGLLWAVAVASEVMMFFLLGPALLRRIGPAALTAAAAAAGVLRWSVMASTSSGLWMLLVQPLHGMTFAAQHLAAMAVLAGMPGRLSATAQSAYAALGTGLASAVLTLAAGPLYERLGAGGFWAMALLCLLAVPAALRLPKERAPRAAGPGSAPRAGGRPMTPI